MTDPTSPPPPSQPPEPPPGYYRASDGRDYPIPEGYTLGADGQFHPIAAPPAAPQAPPTAPPQSAPVGAPPAAPVVKAKWTWNAASILLVAGAVVAAIGAFLPWVKVEDILTRNGMDADGTITLGLAIATVIIGGLGIVYAHNGMKIAALITSALIIVVAIIDIADVQSAIDDSFGLEVSVGIGLYVTLVGGVIAAIGSALTLRSR